MNAQSPGIRSLEAAYRDFLDGEHSLLVGEKGSELAWLRTARESAAEVWSTQGFPRRDQERWKYTNLSALENARISVAEPSSRFAAEAGFPAVVDAGAAAIKVVFVNGYYSADLSRVTAVPGLTVTVLSKLVDDCVANGWRHEGLNQLAAFRAHVEKSDAASETAFAAMNLSFFHDGVLIRLAPGAVVTEPIVIFHFSDFPEEVGESVPMASQRVFVDLGRDSQATVLECFAASPGTGEKGVRYFNNAVCDLRVESGARLSHARLQCESVKAVQIATTRVRQMSNSFCETYQFSLGGELARHDLHITLDGEGAETLLDGLYMADGRRQVDNFTYVEHVKPHTTSSQLYKGILDGESRGVFRGGVRIHPGAQKASASQLNKNLLVSPKAEIDTRPELEIEADDVKAAHGATIGRLDGEQIFYLQTRAIARAEAERLLAFAFAAEIAMRIRQPALNAILREALVEQLRKDRNE